VPYFWSRFNQCQTVAVRDSFQRNGDLIRRDRYPACAQNSEVVVMHVVGNSHQWHASATDELWDFFKRFRRGTTGQVLDMRARQSLGALSVFPNPAASTATVQFTLTSPQAVTVEMRNELGQLMPMPPVSGPRSAGLQEVIMPLANLASGLYLVQVRIADGPAKSVRLSVLAK
jgi:hypothetical protein